MAESIMLCTLAFDGKDFSDFDSFSEDSVTVHARVDLMNKTNFSEVTGRFGFSVKMTDPKIDPGFDINKVKNGVFTVQYTGGSRVTYSGVYTLETGEKTTDGETATNSTKTYGASRMTKES